MEIHAKRHDLSLAEKVDFLDKINCNYEERVTAGCLRSLESLSQP